MILVGIWTNLMPLIKLEAINPPKSPTTPPPNATNTELLSYPFLIIVSQIWSATIKQSFNFPMLKFKN